MLYWIVSKFMDVIDNIFRSMPVTDVQIPRGVYSVLMSVAEGVRYFLPLEYLMPLLYFWMGFYLLSAVLALIKYLKEVFG